MKKSIYFISLLILLTACPENKSEVLEGKTWILTEMSNKAAKNTNTQKAPSLIFDLSENRFSGYSGCNQIMGAFTLNGNEIKIDRIGGTKMMCPEMSMENELISNLNTINKYQIKKDILSLYKDDDKLLVFKAEQ